MGYTKERNNLTGDVARLTWCAVCWAREDRSRASTQARQQDAHGVRNCTSTAHQTYRCQCLAAPTRDYWELIVPGNDKHVILGCAPVLGRALTDHDHHDSWAVGEGQRVADEALVREAPSVQCSCPCLQSQTALFY